MPDSNDPGSLTIKALEAIGVTFTPTYYDPKDFVLRKGVMYRPSPTSETRRLEGVEMDGTALQDAREAEGVAGEARVYGELFGKVLEAITKSEAVVPKTHYNITRGE